MNEEKNIHEPQQPAFLQGDVSDSADMIIPPNAVRIGKQNFIQNIDEWFCPDCNTKGDANSIDFVMISEKVCEEDSIVQYCCAECFEENLYATFNENR